MNEWMGDGVFVGGRLGGQVNIEVWWEGRRLSVWYR